jgi:hypothetical protein
MVRLLVPVLLVLFAWGSLPAGAAPARIGVASVVENEVNGTLGGDTRVLQVGAGVFRNEVITTGRDSSAQLLFRDETSPTLGACLPGVAVRSRVVGTHTGCIAEPSQTVFESGPVGSGTLRPSRADQDVPTRTR